MMAENEADRFIYTDPSEIVLDPPKDKEDHMVAAVNNFAAAAEVHTGAMIALIPAKVDAERLALDGGEPVDELHVTLAYLGEAAEFDDDVRRQIIEAMRAVAAEFGHLVLDAFSVNVFNPTNEDVETAVVLGVSGKELHTLRESVWHELQHGDVEQEVAENHSPWVAHLTLNYTEDLNIDEYIGLTGPVSFDRIRVAFGDHVVDIPLSSSPPDDAESMERLQSRMPAKLKRYWLAGPGAAKIRWGTPGDFTRCVRQLREHFPTNTEGLCANLHHEATGKWPGDRRGKTRGDTVEATTNVVAVPPGTVSTEGGTAVTETIASDTVALADERDGECPPGHHMMPDGECMPDEEMEMDVADIEVEAGAQWEGVLAIENEPTGDRREWKAGAFTWAEPPLPLRWNIEDSHGGIQQTKAVLVGRIDEIWRDGNKIMGRGVLDVHGKHGAEAHRLMKAKMLRGVSIDGDSSDYELVFPKDLTSDDIQPEKVSYSGTRIRAATLVDTPAFAAALLNLISAEDEALLAAADPNLDVPDAGKLNTAARKKAAAEGWAMSDGSYPIRPKDNHGEDDLKKAIRAVGRGGADHDAIRRHIMSRARDLGLTDLIPDSWGSDGGLDATAESLAASVTALDDARPPREWFSDPKLSVPTPITVTDQGRVYGHAAEWNTCHVGFSDTCVTAPYEEDHPYFMTGEVLCADGTRTAVGQITLGTGHAGLSLNATRAVEHYDNTGTAVADVVVGNDEHGIWIAGVLRPGTTSARVRELRASGQVSGDWRRVGGQLRLVGLLAVNVPGFPVPKLQTRVASGAQQALVAAGRSTVAVTLDDDEEEELNRRALRLMAKQLAESIGRDRTKTEV